jgi:molybdopterin synthase catalytic subunit
MADKVHGLNKDRVRLQKGDFSVDAALRLLGPGNIGGTVIFIGTVRGKGPKGKVPHLDYEAYGPMALRTMRDIRKRAVARFHLEDMVIIHRIGRIRAKGRVVMIAAAAAHRDAAFSACRFAIEALKKEVPIFKRELGVWTTEKNEKGGKTWKGKMKLGGRGGGK